MQTITIFAAIVASAVAAPGLLLTHDTHYVPLTSKSTLTKSSQVVNHGSTYVHSPVVHHSVVPVVHAHHVPVVHTPLTSKTTVTKSSQVVNHGGTHVVHSVPVVHSVHSEPTHYVSMPAKSSQYYKLDNTVYHSDHGSVHSSLVPVVHSSPVYVHSSPLVTVKTGDSAVSHHSSTVHETVPVIAYHH